MLNSYGVQSKEQATSDPIASVPSETGDALAPGHDTVAETEEPHEDVEKGDRSAVGRDAPKSEPSENPQARRPARGDEPFEKWEREEMEKLLEQLCGHLGAFRACRFVGYALHVSCSAVPDALPGRRRRREQLSLQCGQVNLPMPVE